MNKVLLSDAPAVCKLVDGVFCVYKPPGETVDRVRRSLLFKLCSELCELECRPPVPYVSIEGDTTKPLKVSVFPSFADNPLVVGPRYQPRDFKCTWATFLGFHTSGVFVLGLNSGTRDVYRIHNLRPVRVYHIKACLGTATDTLFATGKVVEKSTFRHVRRGALEKLLASVQASHQRTMYESCGVDLQSEAAYKMAVSGLIRPANSKLPLIYGIKCVDFEPPNFTLEVHCINEYENYLMALVHSIGAKLHSTATCTAIQCVRHSCFTLEHALLKKHWTLSSVIENMGVCRQLIRAQQEVSHKLSKLQNET